MLANLCALQDMRDLQGLSERGRQHYTMGYEPSGTPRGRTHLAGTERTQGRRLVRDVDCSHTPRPQISRENSIRDWTGSRLHTAST